MSWHGTLSTLLALYKQTPPVTGGFPLTKSADVGSLVWPLNRPVIHDAMIFMWCHHNDFVSHVIGPTMTEYFRSRFDSLNISLLQMWMLPTGFPFFVSIDFCEEPGILAPGWAVMPARIAVFYGKAQALDAVKPIWTRKYWSSQCIQKLYMQWVIRY